MEPTVQKVNKLIAVYARVSTARQEEEGTIESQLLAVREFAAKNGYTIVREYTDEDWSGTILGRPALDQLREDAKKKMWEAVLIYDPDRLSRVYAHQALVMDELREIGIEVLFVTTPPLVSELDRLMYGVKGIFAEYEKARIADRFRLGKMRKVKEGHVLTTEAPYGYTYIPKKDKVHGYYKVNEEEARVVRMIFHWIVDDLLTIRGVVRELQRLGIKPRKSARGVWNTSTLTTLLRNKTYIGEAHYGKSYAVVPEKPYKNTKYKKMRKTSRKVRLEEDWIKIPVLAIIDPDLFEKAQLQLRLNFEQSRRNRKNEYLLAGKIWCVCGSRRTGEGPQHGKHLYYRCTDRVHSFPMAAKCEERGINARIADELVWSGVYGLMTSPDMLGEQITEWNKDREEVANKNVIDTSTAEKEISQLSNKEDRLAKAYAEEAFALDQFIRLVTPVRERIAVLKTQIASTRSQRFAIPAEQPTYDEIDVLVEKAKSALPALKFEAKKAIVMNVIDRIIGTQKKLDVHGYIPISLFNHVELQTIHRNRGDAKRGQINPL